MRSTWAPYVETQPDGENAYVGHLMQLELPKLHARTALNLEDCNVLEVGPKHGNHTLYVAAHAPQSITLVDLPSKHAAVQRWLPEVRCPCFHDSCDFLRWESRSFSKFGLLLFCGVLYHSQEQLRMLKKLRSLATEGAVLVCESATCRTDRLRSDNVVEVHWPERYRGVETITFLPTKRALRSLLEIAGWRAEATSDDHPHLANPDRLALVCTAADGIRTYDTSDVDHAHHGGA